MVDRDAFKIVINNLFDNAIKYSRGKVKIDVYISQGPRYFMLKVEDNGIGLTLKKQDHNTFLWGPALKPRDFAHG